MTFTEQAFVISCKRDEMLGIVARPEAQTDIGVLILVGGPQYRAGSHRQFVLLSRALALAGYAAMRFDFRGMGDSTGDPPGFESVSEDVDAAIDAFMRHCPEVKRIVLLGLCDAASASLLYWQETRDTRIVGMVLLNPWVRSEATHARTQIRHYYTQRLLQAGFWRKLLAGDLKLTQAVFSFLRNLNTARKVAPASGQADELTFQAKMAHGFELFQAPILLLLSGNDFTAKEFEEVVQESVTWRANLKSSLVTVCKIPEADHTFSSQAWRGWVEKSTVEWLKTKVAQ